MGYAAIIADDLTGACDSGIQLYKKGYAVQVLIDRAACLNLKRESPYIYSVSTDTRSTGNEQAYQAVRETASTLREKGITWFYKKVDSVLRGSTGRELEAMLDELGYDVALIAPAYPVAGRIVRNGRLLVNTSCSSADFSGVKAIAKSAKGSCGTIELDAVRSENPLDFQQAVTECYRSGNRLMLVDSETEEDMKRIAHSIGRLPLRILPAGSAGLISHLRCLLERESAAHFQVIQREEGEKASASLPIVMVIGTRHPVTLAQVESLKQCPDDYAFFLLESEGLTEEAIPRQLEQAQATFYAQPGLQHKRCIVVTTNRIYRGTGKAVEVGSDVFNGAITNALAQATHWVLECCGCSSLVLSGGATASAVLEHLGAHQITLMDEPMPGIVAGYTVRKGQRLYVATKSGGFGEKQALADLVRYMQALEHRYCAPDRRQAMQA